MTGERQHRNRGLLMHGESSKAALESPMGSRERYIGLRTARRLKHRPAVLVISKTMRRRDGGPMMQERSAPPRIVAQLTCKRFCAEDAFLGNVNDSTPSWYWAVAVASSISLPSESDLLTAPE